MRDIHTYIALSILFGTCSPPLTSDLFSVPPIHLLLPPHSCRSVLIMVTIAGMNFAAVQVCSPSVSFAVSDADHGGWEWGMGGGWLAGTERQEGVAMGGVGVQLRSTGSESSVRRVPVSVAGVSGMVGPSHLPVVADCDFFMV